MVASVDTSEIQALYFAQGAELKKSVYTDNNLTQNLEGEIANIPLNLAISYDEEEIGETYVYALKAYATEDLSDEGFEVRDENGLRLVVGYTSGSAAKLYAVTNGTLIDKEIDLTGEEVGTFSVTVDQTGATVVINGEVRSSISAVVGTAINWEVSKEGYLTQSGSTSITSGGSTQTVTMEEVPTGGGGVALMVNYHPSSATVTINGTAGNIAVVPTNSPTTITASATGYDTFEPVVKTYTANTVENIYLFKHADYDFGVSGVPTVPPEVDTAFNGYFNGLNWKFEANIPIPSTPIVASSSDIRMFMGSYNSYGTAIGFTIENGDPYLYGLENISSNELELDRDPSDTANYAELPTKLEITPISLGKGSTYQWANVHVKITITNLINNSTRVVESDVIYDNNSCVVKKDLNSPNQHYSGWSLDNSLMHADSRISNPSTYETIQLGNATIYYSEE